MTVAAPTDFVSLESIRAAAADLVGVEVAIGYLKQWDNSASKFYNVEAASAGDHVIHQLVPNNVQTADYILVGNAVPFMQARFDMNIVQTYTGDATAWKYWNGTAWAALTTINENSDAADADGDRSFGQDGGPFFVPPAAWAASTIDGVTGYWLKVELTDASKINVKGTMNSHRHTITQPGAPFQVPMDCKITAVTLRDEATTVHTATDIKCVLMNITKGANTREMVFPQDQRTAVFTPFTMSCDSGDVLSLFVTQEDGTNEMGPLTIEIAADIPKQ